MKPQTALTFEQKIAVAYAHHVLGQKIHHIAVHYQGINQGRLSEACKAVEDALKGK